MSRQSKDQYDDNGNSVNDYYYQFIDKKKPLTQEVKMRTINKSGRIINQVKCCGRLAHIYLSKKIQHCHSCYTEYDFTGHNLEYFGSGLSKDEYHKQQIIENQKLGIITATP